MGGQGSSRWGKHRAKPNADGRKSLKVERWDELGYLKSGHSFVWKWNAKEPFKASIAVTVADDLQSMTLAYKPEPTSKSRDAITEKDVVDAGIAYVVGLSWDDCHLGGRRPYFICPGVDCHRRTVRLYARETLFYCRDCAGLAYSTQRMNDAQRALVKASRIKKKLGQPYADQNAIAIPLRPAGMHLATYFELCRVLESLFLRALNRNSVEPENQQPAEDESQLAA